MEYLSRFYLLWVCFLLPAPLFALQDAPHMVYRSPHYAGRGNTGIASCEGEDAIFYNPAALAIGNGIYRKTVLFSPTISISTKTQEFLSEYLLQEIELTQALQNQIGNVQHVSLSNFTGIVLRRVALGMLTNVDATLLLAKDHNKGGFETITGQSLATGGLTFSIAEKVGKWPVYMGLTGKYLYRNQAGVSVNATEFANTSLSTQELSMAGFGFGIDLGILYTNTSKARLPWSIGITGENLPGINFSVAQASTSGVRPLENIKPTLNLGFAIIPRTKVSTIKFLLDYRDALDAYKTSQFKKIALGTELAVKDVIGVTGGIHQGYPTVGIYFDIRAFRIDLGMYGVELGKHPGSRALTKIYITLASGI